MKLSFYNSYIGWRNYVLFLFIKLQCIDKNKMCIQTHEIVHVSYYLIFVENGFSIVLSQKKRF